MRPAIINFAKGAWYPRGQSRLVQSLKDVGFEGIVYAWQSESQIAPDCPSHETIPYGFKIYAFNQAKAMGHRLILWCDAAVWAVKPLDSIFEQIKRDGHIFFAGGWNCAQWTSDRCLAEMNVTRDQAEKMPMYMACCMGLDMDNPRSAEFLAKLTSYCNRACFHGDWQNDHKQVSSDPRCLGHRHDQSVGSILSFQLGMAHTIGHETFFAYYNNKAGVPYRYGQFNDMEGIKASVALLSQGM